MPISGFLRFYNLYFLINCISSAHAWYHPPPHQPRDIISAIGSLADSVFGISTAPNTDQTTAQSTAQSTDQVTAQATASTSATPQADLTTTAVPQVVTTAPTATATTSSSQTGATGTDFDASTTSTAQSATSSSMSTILGQSPSRTLFLSSSQASPTTTTPENPVQGLSSSSASSPGIKQDNGNRVPTAGVAVGVVFGTLILAGITYLLFRHFRNARDKTATPKPSEFGEMKRVSYLDDDAESGMVANPGLGLGEVSQLKTATNNNTTYDVEAYRTRSRAGSEGSFVREGTVPISSLNRREPPLPQLPIDAQESWPLVSAFGTAHPLCLSIKIPATGRSLGSSGGGYVPCRRETAPVIGLAVPMHSGHIRNPQSLDHQNGHTRPVASFAKARRLSGIHELL